VRDDSRAAPYLKQREFIERRNKIFIIVLLIASMPLSWFMYNSGFLSKDGFSTIIAAIIGGFVGSSVSYIIQSK
jgi:membrane protein DedA with SNARE-associated domain